MGICQRTRDNPVAVRLANKLYRRWLFEFEHDRAALRFNFNKSVESPVILTQVMHVTGDLHIVDELVKLDIEPDAHTVELLVNSSDCISELDCVELVELASTV